MPSYIIQNCLNSDVYVLSATSLTTGTTISFSIAEDNFCGTVLSETTDPITPLSLYNDNSTSCCKCIIDTYDYNSLKFEDCERGVNYYLDITTFCSIYGGLPNLSEIFIVFNSETTNIFCATFVEFSYEEPDPSLEPDEGPFSVCSDCIDEPPRSANTENFICIPDCEFTGSTAVVPPHPIWTDGYGRQVTQLNMVTLGGPNGLNA